MATTRKVAAKPKSKSRKPTKKSKSSKSQSVSSRRKVPAKAKSGKPAADSATSTKAMRLTFSYDGNNVKLVSQQRVEMTVPPSDPVTGFKRNKGFWAELKSEQDKTLYRHVMHNPTRNDAEVFSDDPEQSISRVPAPKRKGVFVIVVPDTDQGQEVTLSSSSPPTAGPESGLRSLASKPAAEIFRVKLKK